MKTMLMWLLIMTAGVATAHHYKGLPHYSYFENYPKIPILEFIAERPDYELFVTIYNFQGLKLDKVDSPDDVRFYMYLNDVQKNTSYPGKIDFAISSHGKEIFSDKGVSPEQESIFILQHKIVEQDDLVLSATFVDASGQRVHISLPIQITQTFWQKYGIYLAIAGFFSVVMSVKLVLRRRERKSNPATDQRLSYA